MRRQTILPFATTWMNLEGIMQSEIHPTRKRNAVWYHSLCCCLVAKSCPTICDSTDGSAPGLPPGVCPSSCPLNWWCLPAVPSSVTFFPSAFSSSQPQGLFQWVGCSHQMAEVLELQLQHQSLQWISQWILISFRTDWLDLLAVQGTLKSLLQHHSSKHQFFHTQLSLWPNSHVSLTSGI